MWITVLLADPVSLLAKMDIALMWVGVGYVVKAAKRLVSASDMAICKRYVPPYFKANPALLSQSFYKPAVAPAHVAKPPEISWLQQQPLAALKGVV